MKAFYGDKTVNEIEKENRKMTAKEQEKKTLDIEHYKQIWNIVYDSIENYKELMDTFAGKMADFSDNPTDISFVNAAKNFKNCRKAYEEQKELLDYLDTINPEV